MIHFVKLLKGKIMKLTKKGSYKVRVIKPFKIVPIGIFVDDRPKTECVSFVRGRATSKHALKKLVYGKHR